MELLFRQNSYSSLHSSGKYLEEMKHPKNEDGATFSLLITYLSTPSKGAVVVVIPALSFIQHNGLSFIFLCIALYEPSVNISKISLPLYVLL